VVLGLVAAVKVYRLYHAIVLDHSTRRIQAATARKQVAAARGAELKNEQLEVKIDLERKLPELMAWALQNGYAAKYNKDGLELYQAPSAGGLRISEAGNAGLLGPGAAGAGAGPAGDLPTNVLYEEVRRLVPPGHVLVGVGANGLVDTVAWAVGACIWILGLSGTGKTSTTVLRVEERYQAGHKFLGVDPHFFKNDSLTNAVKAYAGAFLRPLARSAEEANQVLTLFLNTFLGRKNGQIKPGPDGRWPALTLIVDEVGSLMDATDALEKENADLIKRIARICGQEARDFQMGGIFISQQATGLAFLRKVALMVIVHQLLMASEKELVCNDPAVRKDMERWPIGRTYVFGVGFGANGARTVQQPYFPGPASVAGDGGIEDNRFTVNNQDNQADQELPEDEQAEEEEEGAALPAPVPALSGDLRIVYDAVQQLIEEGRRVSSRELEALTGFKKDKANALLNRLEDLGYISRKAV